MVGIARMGVAVLALGCVARVGCASLLTGFEAGDAAWQSCGTVATSGPLGVVAPTQGASQALVQTRASYDDTAVAAFLNVPDNGMGLLNQFYYGASAVKMDVTAPAGATLTFDMDMLTQENGLQGGQYPDAAFLTVGPAGQAATARQLLAVPMLGVEWDHIADPWTTPTGSGFLRHSGYATYSYTFTAAGTYTVGFMVANEGDDVAQSALALDNVQLVTGQASAAPEPGSVLLLGMGVAGLMVRRRRGGAA